jgi:hypothetical protein
MGDLAGVDTPFIDALLALDPARPGGGVLSALSCAGFVPPARKWTMDPMSSGNGGFQQVGPHPCTSGSSA